jgi:gliding motility-associated-like protein
MKKFYLLVFLIFLVFASVRASHIVGGEFKLTALQKEYNYQLSLNLYFDKFNGAPSARDKSIVAYVFDKRNNQKKGEFVLPEAHSEPVKYTNESCTIERLSTLLITYSATIDLDPKIYNDPEGYYVVWERCCRNATTVNILSPGHSGMTFYMEFPAVVANNTFFRNSSPQFNIPFGEYACLGQPFEFEFGATDPDGDELRYSIVDPLKGNGQPGREGGKDKILPRPYKTVDWQAGYNASSSIAGDPCLRVDAGTGKLSLTPNVLGLHVFSVLCEEFRAGVKIGEVRRDFQLLVRDCPPYDAPSVQLYLNDTKTFYREGDTLLLSGDAAQCFDLKITDPSVQDVIKIQTIPVNFSTRRSMALTSEIATTGLQDTLTVRLCGPPCEENEDKVYIVDVVVSDNSCPFPLTDRLRVYYKLVPEANKAPAISLQPAMQYYEISVGEELHFNVHGFDPDGDQVSLSSTGKGFDMAALGMQFNTATGAGNVSSLFRWSPDCNALTATDTEGLFTLQFTAKDNRCYAMLQDTIQVHVRVRDRVDESIDYKPANVFTPNGDGINDTYILPDLPIDNCAGRFEYIEIFNRWGQLMFKADHRDFAWDGLQAPNGTYFYYIHYTSRSFKGTLTIMR